MDHTDERVRIYTPEELNSMPCIEEGPWRDLKVETEDFRVWIDPAYEDVDYEIWHDGQWRPAWYHNGAFLPAPL